MEVKDIILNLNIKNYKVGKHLHLVLLDAIADFERVHPRVVPGLLAALRKGDGRGAKEGIEDLKKIVLTLSDQITELDIVIEEYMYKYIKIKEGLAVHFIDTDGNTSYSMKKDEKIILGRQDDEEPKKKKLKKKPAKKRASKKTGKKKKEE